MPTINQLVRQGREVRLQPDLLAFPFSSTVRYTVHEPDHLTIFFGESTVFFHNVRDFREVGTVYALFPVCLGNFPGNVNKFTQRELDVLNLVCKGLTSQEIGEKLYISDKTVETHRTNIFHKAEVRNSSELIVWAIKNEYFTI